jgi:hypothetical protein
MSQCQGRRTTPKSAPLFFAGCPRLHKNKPLSFLGVARCTNKADDLCSECKARVKSTEFQLVKRAGKYIPNQETMFHGRITEPIPAWSRLYKGPWFEAQIQAGYTLSEETQQAVAAMEQATYENLPKKPVANMIIGSVVEIEIPVKKVTKKKVVTKSVSAPVLSVVTTPITPKKKLIVKKAEAPATELCGYYSASENRITLFELVQ